MATFVKVVAIDTADMSLESAAMHVEDSLNTAIAELENAGHEVISVTGVHTKQIYLSYSTETQQEYTNSDPGYIYTILYDKKITRKKTK